MLKPLLFAVALACATSCLAAGSDFAEAMRVRRLVILDPTLEDLAEQTLVLPVSRGFDQRGTQLCWAYASLSGLETLARVAAPEAALELSRRALQYRTIQDRWTRRIHGTATYTGERGTAVDALAMIGAHGLVAYGDYADIDDPYGSGSISSLVGAATGVPAKLQALACGLDQVYGILPGMTHLEGQALTPAALAAAVAAQPWRSYAVAKDGAEGFRPHPDPDARAGQQSWFEPEAKLVARVRAQLAAGCPLEITIGGHCVLLYGAAYDAAGKPVRYYIKDSYPDYFYKADPARIMRNLVEMTTVVRP